VTWDFPGSKVGLDAVTGSVAGASREVAALAVVAVERQDDLE
jgi:hypothetical protein